MDMLDKFILTLNDYLYSYVIIAIILVVGIFFTIRGRGMQFTLFPEMFRVLTDKATIEGKGKKGYHHSKLSRFLLHHVSVPVISSVLRQLLH